MSYTSIYQGSNIDNGITKANKLPASNSGIIGQFLKKANASGDTEWADVVSVTTKMNNVENTDMTNLLLFFTNITITSSDWQEGTSYTSYPYYAIIPCQNVTSNYYAEVIFNPDDATSGHFACVCETISNGVKIFSNYIPSTNITIPTIVCIKGE